MKKILSAILLVILLTSVFAIAAIAEGNAVYTHGTVNLRKTASVDGKILACLKDGTKCEVIDSKKDSRDIKWYKVNVKGKTGWVSSVYANATKDEGTILGYLTTTGKVNLRKSANGRPVLDVIPKGTKVAYFDSKTVDGLKWYLVRYDDTIGWACGKYLSNGGSEKKTYIYATEGDSYIRKQPKTTAAIVDLLYKGEKAEFLGNTKKDSRGVIWYNVSYDGSTGWISSTFTTKK